MFDNLRDSAESSSFYEEEQSDLYKEPVPQTASKQKKRRSRSNKRFLGLSPQQRFFVALMLMFTVCILGVLAMFVTGSMSLF
jgi:cytoskeletal protein RodZ